MKKLKKKLKSAQQQQELIQKIKLEAIELEEEENPVKKKKKKKKKNKDTTQEVENDKIVMEEEEKIETMEIKIELVKENPEKIAPIVGYFPSGYNCSSEEKNGPSVTVYTKKPRRVQVVVSPNQDSNIEFFGSTHEGEGPDCQICTYALGVLDRDTHTLKIVPIASNKILRLEPRVKGLNSDEKKLPKESIEEDVTPAEKDHQKRIELTTVFGSKKDQAKDKKHADIKEKSAPKGQAVIDKIDGVKINKKALETTVGIHSRNIPPHDTIAVTPERAYPLDQIILSAEWDHLLDILEHMQSGTKISPDAYPSYVCNRIDKLMEIKDEEEKKKLSCICSYITHLIKFKDQRSANSASTKNHYLPGILNRRFSTTFADSDSNHKRNFPSIEKRNFLISYVLVLALIVDGYRTDMYDIARDLKISVGTVREHYTNLGCKLKLENKTLYATLPVPLEFPKLNTRKRKRRN
ncbi:hypothetical protein IFM89_024200 [Coptis chinensis]|uniref:DNA-directed RNA polymerase I subunit rpa49 n=1 Tax=Coptis chinensis TaxID=261450 RepID=A0A835H5E3_9MAGN|nr:hypothetical protein IFM89_024200 [Coptis chinensis]